jgi:hypothetical protein
MKKKLGWRSKITEKRLKEVVYVLLINFILVIISISPLGLSTENMSLRQIMIIFSFASWILFFLLGTMLIVLTLKSKVKGKLKAYLLLTGFSSAGVFIAIILHNLVSALFNVEEPVFFIIAIIVCPICFLIGLIRSIVMFRRKRKK